MNIFLVAGEHRVAPSLLFRWRKLASEGTLRAVGSILPFSAVCHGAEEARIVHARITRQSHKHAALARQAQFTAHAVSAWLVRNSTRATTCTQTSQPIMPTTPDLPDRHRFVTLDRARATVAWAGAAENYMFRRAVWQDQTL